MADSLSVRLKKAGSRQSTNVDDRRYLGGTGFFSQSGVLYDPTFTAKAVNASMTRMQGMPSQQVLPYSDPERQYNQEQESALLDQRVKTMRTDGTFDKIGRMYKQLKKKRGD